MALINTIHKTAYAGIDAALPLQSQHGKTVLITGGAGGIGFAIARAFAVANASHLILLGRDESRLSRATRRLKDEVPSFAGQVTIQVAELVDPDSLERVWNNVIEIASEIDVLILNAAYMGESRGTLQNGWRQVWEQYEVNVRGNLTLVDKFVQQTQVEGRGKKFIVNVTSDAINNYDAMEGQRPYAATKASWTCLLQHIALEIPVSNVQIINMHPGGVFTETIARMLPQDCYEWDSDTLPGNFAVWAATDQAAFLHGRYCWAGWDVEEMGKKLDNNQLANQQFLRVGVNGMEYPSLQK